MLFQISVFAHFSKMLYKAKGGWRMKKSPHLSIICQRWNAWCTGRHWIERLSHQLSHACKISWQVPHSIYLKVFIEDKVHAKVCSIPTSWKSWGNKENKSLMATTLLWAAGSRAEVGSIDKVGNINLFSFQWANIFFVTFFFGKANSWIEITFKYICSNIIPNQKWLARWERYVVEPSECVSMERSVGVFYNLRIC